MALAEEVRAEREFFRRLALNRAILKNAYLYLPVAEDGHEESLQVGREQVTSPDCGVHVCYYICRDKEHHKGVVYHDVDYTNKNAVAHGHRWCKNSGCRSVS